MKIILTVTATKDYKKSLNSDRAALQLPISLMIWRNRGQALQETGDRLFMLFVETRYEMFKGHFQAKREKIPQRVRGIEGMYSLKRLTEG